MTRFSADVNALVQGTETFERLMQRCRPAYARFVRDIRGTAPDFRPFVPGEEGADAWVVADFEPADICADEDEGSEGKAGCRGTPKPMYLDDVRAHIQQYVITLLHARGDPVNVKSRQVTHARAPPQRAFRRQGRADTAVLHGVVNAQ